MFHACIWHQKSRTSLFFTYRKGNRRCACSYGRAGAKIECEALKCNTQRACFLDHFGVLENGTIRFRLLCWGRRFTTFYSSGQWHYPTSSRKDTTNNFESNHFKPACMRYPWSAKTLGRFRFDEELLTFLHRDCFGLLGRRE